MLCAMGYGPMSYALCVCGHEDRGDAGGEHGCADSRVWSSCARVALRVAGPRLTFLAVVDLNVLSRTTIQERRVRPGRVVDELPEAFAGVCAVLWPPVPPVFAWALASRPNRTCSLVGKIAASSRDPCSTGRTTK